MLENIDKKQSDFRKNYATWSGNVGKKVIDGVGLGKTSFGKYYKGYIDSEVNRWHEREDLANKFKSETFFKHKK